MKKQLLLLTLLALTGISYALDTPADMAKAAREVGKEQGMPDAAAPLPAQLQPPRLPDAGEGFFPAWDGRKENPYYKNLARWCGEFLKKKPLPYGPSTPERKVYTGTGGSRPDYGTRTDTAIAKNLFWLCTHPQSEYYMDQEVFRRMLRRALSYANDYNVHAGKYRDYWNDFFAIGPELYLLRMIRDIYGAYLLPSQRQAIDDCMRKAGTFWLAQYNALKKDRFPAGRYANRDLGFANILLNAGLYLNNREMLRAADFLVQAQRKNQYADGGFAYIGSQNESPGYHQADVDFLTRYLASTKEKKTAELLKNSQNCALISNEPGGVAETWTAASWKHMWNGSNFSTAESVLYYSNNPCLRAELDGSIARSGKKMPDALHIPFYRHDIKPVAKPHDYTVIDRNLAGVRARYGLWSSAWTLRKLDAREPGHATLLGALTLDRNGEAYRMNSAMMFARPSAWIGKNREKLQDWAFLTDHLKSAQAVGRDYSAFGATYQLHMFRSSTKGAVTELTGTQVFLIVKDRIFGILAIEPRQDVAARELNAEIRLGYGGFKDKKRHLEIKAEGTGVYTYGKFRFRVLGSNFPKFEIRRKLVRTAEANDLTFFATPGADGQFRKGERYFVAFELCPESSVLPSVEAAADGKANTLTVRADGKSYRLRYNAQTNQLKLDTDDSAPAWKNFDDLVQKRK